MLEWKISQSGKFFCCEVVSVKQQSPKKIKSMLVQFKTHHSYVREFRHAKTSVWKKYHYELTASGATISICCSNWRWPLSLRGSCKMKGHPPKKLIPSGLCPDFPSNCCNPLWVRKKISDGHLIGSESSPPPYQLFSKTKTHPPKKLLEAKNHHKSRHVFCGFPWGAPFPPEKTAPKSQKHPRRYQ